MDSFYTQVIQKSPLYHSTEQIKDMALLAPVFRAKVEAIIADAKAQGHTLVVIETYRSDERQLQLFERHATELRNEGVHHFGLAADLGFMKPDGSGINWDADYSVLRDLAKKREVISGMDWGEPDRPHSFRDLDHIQDLSVADQNKVFRGEWYPPEDGSYNPFAHL